VANNDLHFTLQNLHYLHLKYLLFHWCPQTKSQSVTQYTRAGLVSLRDFYQVSGWLKKSLKEKRQSDDSEFNWNDDDQGTIMGNIIELREIINDKESPFQNFRIETEVNYIWKNCNKKMVKPCPYYYTALASLFAPIVLALATLSIIVCWSKCYKQGNLIAVI
jgi:hypothetical protein